MHAVMRPAAAVVAIALSAAAFAGCMHVTENSTVNANGSSTEVLTMAFSPELSSILKMNSATLVKQSITQLKKQPFPGQVSVTAYTDGSGWKGAKITIKLANLATLRKLETGTDNGNESSPAFTVFSITHHGSEWKLYAKVDPAALANPKDSLMTLKQMEALGLSEVISFKLPGRVVSDNASSKSANGTVSWDMLKPPKALEATWAD